MTVAFYTENSPRLPVSLGEFHGYSGTLRRALQSDPLFDAYAENFEKQAGGLNEKYSSGCKALTETTKNALTTILNDTKNQLSDMEQTAQKKIITCAWISITAVILCATLCALAVLWSR